jgi:hypothetical protein
MNKIVVIPGEKDPLLWALIRILGEPRVIFDKENITGIPTETVILLNTSGNTAEMVNKWVWREIRLNEKKIGKERAGLPVIVLGTDKKFLETPEGKVFRDFPLHHKYFPKPVNLYAFLTGFSSIYPVKPHSLCVINGDAPDNLSGALEHDLTNILQKFDFEGSSEKLMERFRKIEIDLDNYKKLTKNRKTLAKLTKDVKILKDEILKKRGNIWQPKKY